MHRKQITASLFTFADEVWLRGRELSWAGEITLVTE